MCEAWPRYVRAVGRFAFWTLSYAGLVYERLDSWENFHNDDYSPVRILLDAVSMALLFALSVYLVMEFWEPARPYRIGFVAANIVMIVLVYVSPVWSFEFFLFKHRHEGNPFSACKRDCALVIGPGEYQLGINQTLDSFVVYSPRDSFSSCIGDAKSKECLGLLLGLALGPKYTIGHERCETQISRLASRNYYLLSAYECS